MTPKTAATLFAKMAEIFNRVADCYPNDLALDFESLMTRDHDSKIINWSVGLCGSHLGYYDSPNVAPAWLHSGSSYTSYEHYRLCTRTGTVEPVTWTEEQIARNDR